MPIWANAEDDDRARRRRAGRRRASHDAGRTEDDDDQLPTPPSALKSILKKNRTVNLGGVTTDESSSDGSHEDQPQGTCGKGTGDDIEAAEDPDGSGNSRAAHSTVDRITNWLRQALSVSGEAGWLWSGDDGRPSRITRARLLGSGHYRELEPGSDGPKNIFEWEALHPDRLASDIDNPHRDAPIKEVVQS